MTTTKLLTCKKCHRPKKSHKMIVLVGQNAKIEGFICQSCVKLRAGQDPEYTDFEREFFAFLGREKL